MYSAKQMIKKAFKCSRCSLHILIACYVRRDHCLTNVRETFEGKACMLRKKGLECSRSSLKILIACCEKKDHCMMNVRETFGGETLL
jgi:hypothetical protein